MPDQWKALTERAAAEAAGVGWWRGEELAAEGERIRRAGMGFGYGNMCGIL